MAAWFGGPPPHEPLAGTGTPDPTGHLEPVDARETARRWQLRALEWRAVALAEAVSGPGVVPRLVSDRGFGELTGMVELTVPFDHLGTHREAESRFLSAAARDPLLGSSQLVYLFRARP